MLARSSRRAGPRKRCSRPPAGNDVTQHGCARPTAARRAETNRMLTDGGFFLVGHDEVSLDTLETSSVGEQSNGCSLEEYRGGVTEVRVCVRALPGLACRERSHSGDGCQRPAGLGMHQRFCPSGAAESPRLSAALQRRLQRQKGTETARRVFCWWSLGWRVLLLRRASCFGHPNARVLRM
jgi:hypothetical protein